MPNQPRYRGLGRVLRQRLLQDIAGISSFSREAISPVSKAEEAGAKAEAEVKAIEELHHDLCGPFTLTAESWQSRTRFFNDGAIIDLKSFRLRTSAGHGKCQQCHCPLYGDECCCPKCHPQLSEEPSQDAGRGARVLRA